LKTPDSDGTPDYCKDSLDSPAILVSDNLNFATESSEVWAAKPGNRGHGSNLSLT
jgi:hypothetical protein